jgi:hypothetical protein
VTQLYPQAAGTLFVALNDSQDSIGGYLTRFHTGIHQISKINNDKAPPKMFQMVIVVKASIIQWFQQQPRE